MEQGLLIGINCSKALKPEVLLHTEGDRLYALVKVLGGCLFELLPKIGKVSSVACSHIVVHYSVTKEISYHSFRTVESIKDVTTKKMLR